MALETLLDLVPDLVLLRAGLIPRAAAPVGGGALGAPQPGVGGVWRDAERLGVALVVPAAVLDAANRDLDLRAGWDQDRLIDRSVLLRARDQLALLEQHALV